MGLLSGLKKTFKSITGSTIGRTLLVASAVYVGGGMLGMWNTHFDSINGLLAPEGAGAGGGATPAMAASNASTMMNAAPAAAETTQASAGYDMLGATSSSAGGTITGGQTASPAAQMIQQEAPRMPDVQGGAMDMGVGTDQMRSQFVHGAGAPQQKPGFVSRAAQQVLDFYKGDVAKAALTAQIGGAIKGAFAPTARETAEAQFDARRRYELQRAQDRNQNFNVGSVKLGMRPPLIG